MCKYVCVHICTCMHMCVHMMICVYSHIHLNKSPPYIKKWSHKHVYTRYMKIESSCLSSTRVFLQYPISQDKPARSPIPPLFIPYISSSYITFIDKGYLSGCSVYWNCKYLWMTHLSHGRGTDFRNQRYEHPTWRPPIKLNRVHAYYRSNCSPMPGFRMGRERNYTVAKYG